MVAIDPPINNTAPHPIVSDFIPLSPINCARKEGLSSGTKLPYSVKRIMHPPIAAITPEISTLFFELCRDSSSCCLERR